MGNKVALYDLWGKNYYVNWFCSYRKYAEYIIEDDKIRSLLKRLDSQYHWGISKIIIERISNEIKIEIIALKPGAIIGKTGTDLAILHDKIKAVISSMQLNTHMSYMQCVAKNAENKNNQVKPEIKIQVNPVRKPELDATSVAKKIAYDLSKGKQYKFLIKKYIADSMRFGAKGIKILCSGRLGGVEIARKFGIALGSVPRQTISANIDYASIGANTNSGICGVKVWIYKGSRRA